MATVASEAVRYRWTAFSRSAIAADIAWRPFAAQYATAKQAAEALVAVDQDLYTVLVRYYVVPLLPGGNPYVWPNPIPGFDDPLDLIRYLQYISLAPFLAMEQARNLNLLGAAPTLDDQLFSQRRQAILNSALLAEAYIRNTTVPALLATANYSTHLNYCTVTPNASVQNVPALGAVEMLCRTVAVGCASLGKC
jgi:hypothetical protein